jgi:hypothetical protein
MDTSKLIDNLTQDLQPVKPLWAPIKRAILMSILALVFVTGMIALLGGPRADWLNVATNPLLISGDILMLAAGFMSCVAAFTLAVPDTKIRKPVIMLLGAATVIWIGICLYAAASLTPQAIQAEITDIGKSSACVKALIFMSILPLVVSFFMAARAVPIWRGWTGYALTLSMASFGAFGMRFFCPSDSYAHLLLWHFMPVVILSVVGGLVGRIILRFRM